MVAQIGAVENRLHQLQVMNPELEAVAVVGVEGLSIASSAPGDETQLSSMSAAMVGLGERIAVELGRGKLDHIYIHGDLGCVLLMSINIEAVLTAVVSEDAKLGMVLLDMKRAVDDLARLL